MQEKVERLRGNIDIEVQRTSGFSISFVDTNPQLVAQIANAIASDFVEEHLKVREQQSTGTTRFLEAELTRVEAQLKEKEESLTAFKKQHMGALPQDLDTNLRIMEQLNQKVSSLEQRLDEARKQKSLLEQQQANLQNTPTFIGMSDDDISGLEDAGSPELHQLKQTLDALRLKYTDKHPDVVRIRKMIQQIEERVEQERPIEEPSGLTDDSFSHSQGDNLMSAQALIFETQKASLEAVISDMWGEKARIEQEIGDLQKRIGDTPRKQLTLISLQRDYNTIKGQYDSLLQ
jgi:uncharacterized protein involved in exopolysaccharide biosynthesis